MTLNALYHAKQWRQMSNKHGENMTTTKERQKIPHRLFDFLIENFALKNDNQLAKRLEIGQSALSKFRSGRPVTANLILKVHENFEIPIRDIKALL